MSRQKRVCTAFIALASCARGNARDVDEIGEGEAEAEAESEGEPEGCFASDACQPPEGAKALLCDPVCQAGCADGAACVVNSGELQCVVLEGGVQACDTGCAADIPCEAGSTCRAEGMGPVCARYCWDEGDCPVDWICNLVLTSEPETIRVCSPLEDCDPLANAGCAQDEGCYVVRPEASCPVPGTQCLDLGELGSGDACSYANACAPGLICVNNVCRRLCIMDEDCGNSTCDAVTISCGVSKDLETLASYGICQK